MLTNKNFYLISNKIPHFSVNLFLQHEIEIHVRQVLVDYEPIQLLVPKIQFIYVL